MLSFTNIILTHETTTTLYLFLVEEKKCMLKRFLERWNSLTPFYIKTCNIDFAGSIF